MVAASGNRGKKVPRRTGQKTDNVVSRRPRGTKNGKRRITTVVDTNVFLSTGEEVFSRLHDRDFVIPLIVYRELEKYRTDQGGRGYAARTVIRLLERLRVENPGMNLATQGVPVGAAGNTIRIETDHKDLNVLIPDLRDVKSADMEIMAVAKALLDEAELAELRCAGLTDAQADEVRSALDGIYRDGYGAGKQLSESVDPYLVAMGRIQSSDGAPIIDDGLTTAVRARLKKIDPDKNGGMYGIGLDGEPLVELITNDAPLRFQASVFEHIPASAYGEEDGDRFSGEIRLDLNLLGYDGDPREISDETLLAMVDRTYAEQGYAAKPPYHALVTLIYDDQPVMWLIKNGKSFTDVDWSVSIGKVHPKKDEDDPSGYNIAQVVAMSYLNDTSIPMLSFAGVAGAGKSFLPIMYGLDAVRDGVFDKITVFRPMFALGRQEQGFLKGDSDEKMRPWAQATWDSVYKYDQMQHNRVKSGKQAGIPDATGRLSYKELEDKYAGVITIEPITYLRGRTLDNQFVIVDDAQSLDRSVILDIISRLGQGSRIVFTYDLDQQDNPYLSEGTSIASIITRLQSERLFAHINFTKSERSELASLAARMLMELRQS